MRHWEYITVTLHRKMSKSWTVDEGDADIPEDWRNRHGGDYDSLGSFCNLMDEAGWELITAAHHYGLGMILSFRRPTR